MKNFEKYKDAIIDFLNNASCRDCTRNCDDCNTCILSILEEKLGVYTRYELEQHLNEEYVEPIQLTHDEYVILKNLDRKFKYICKDKMDCTLVVFMGKPKKSDFCWLVNERNSGLTLEHYNHLFQFIKWEDEEPYSIEQLIDDYEKEHEDERIINN